MTEAVVASKVKRTPSRLGYRSGYGARPRAGHWPDPWGRTLITRVGKLDLRVPQDGMAGSPPSCSSATSVRNGAGGGAGGDVRAGVSTGKVKAITEELCGHSFSASSISAINKRLDESLAQFASRRLSEAFRT